MSFTDSDIYSRGSSELSLLSTADRNSSVIIDSDSDDNSLPFFSDSDMGTPIDRRSQLRRSSELDGFGTPERYKNLTGSSSSPLLSSRDQLRLSAEALLARDIPPFNPADEQSVRQAIKDSANFASERSLCDFKKDVQLVRNMETFERAEAVKKAVKQDLQFMIDPKAVPFGTTGYRGQTVATKVERKLAADTTPLDAMRQRRQEVHEDLAAAKERIARKREALKDSGLEHLPGGLSILVDGDQSHAEQRKDVVRQLMSLYQLPADGDRRLLYYRIGDLVESGNASLRKTPGGKGGAYFCEMPVKDGDGKRIMICLGILKVGKQDVGELENAAIGLRNPLPTDSHVRYVARGETSRKEAGADERARLWGLEGTLPPTVEIVVTDQVCQSFLKDSSSYRYLPPRMREGVHEKIGPSLKTAVCSFQEFLDDSQELSELVHEAAKNGDQNAASLRFNQRSWERALLKLRLSQEQDGAMSNIRVVKDGDEYQIVTTDSAFSHPIRHGFSLNGLTALPNIKEPVSADYIADALRATEDAVIFATVDSMAQDDLDIREIGVTIEAMRFQRSLALYAREHPQMTQLEWETRTQIFHDNMESKEAATLPRYERYQKAVTAALADYSDDQLKMRLHDSRQRFFISPDGNGGQVSTGRGGGIHRQAAAFKGDRTESELRAQAAFLRKLEQMNKDMGPLEVDLRLFLFEEMGEAKALGQVSMDDLNGRFKIFERRRHPQTKKWVYRTIHRWVISQSRFPTLHPISDDLPQDDTSNNASSSSSTQPQGVEDDDDATGHHSGGCE